MAHRQLEMLDIPHPQRYTPTRKATRSGIFEFILVYAAQYSDLLCVSSPIAFFLFFSFLFSFFIVDLVYIISKKEPSVVGKRQELFYIS